MAKSESLHHLDNVDIKKRTAVCSTCGPTGISVRKVSQHPDRIPYLTCIKRYREIVRDSQRRRREQARLQNPNWKPKHSLSEIDPKKMQGVCAVCGPTDILKATTYQNQTYYRCAINMRKQARDYARLH